MGSACSYEGDNSSTQNNKELPSTVNFLYNYNYFQFSTTTNSLKNIQKDLLIIFEKEDFDLTKNPHFTNLTDQALQLQKIFKAKKELKKEQKFFNFQNLNADKKPIVNLKFKNISIILVDDLKNSKDLRTRATEYFERIYLDLASRSIAITQFPLYLKRSRDEDFNVFIDSFLLARVDKAQFVTVVSLSKQSNTFHKKLIRSLKAKYDNKQ